MRITDGDIRLLAPEGELDVVATGPLLERVPELVSGAAALVLDLTAVAFFDSSAVRLVDRLSRSAGAAGVPFVVVAPPGRLPRRVLEIVGLAEALVEDDLPAARTRVLG